MLTSTFIHAQGIGAKTEKRIWQLGAKDWEAFMGLHPTLELTSKQKYSLVPVVEESISRYDKQDFSWFAKQMPSSEHWRAFRSPGQKIGYLDIETTGMSSAAAITVIGLYDGENMKTYIKGHNLEEFLDDIGQFTMLITYAGASFDLPMLRNGFPGLVFDQMHIDLCPFLRKIGLKGGLKGVEIQMGIERPDEVKGMDGFEAIRLWREYEWGSQESLDRLIAYNREDVINMKMLAEYGFEEHRKRLISDAETRRKGDAAIL